MEDDELQSGADDEEGADQQFVHSSKVFPSFGDSRGGGTFLDALIIRKYDQDLEEELKKSALETEEYRVERAASYLRDALNGKGVYHRTGKWSDRAHFLQVDARAQSVLLFACCVHLGLVFFEPASYRDQQLVAYWERMLLHTVEFLCIITYCVFLVARIVLLGRKNFIGKWYNHALYVTITLFFLDALIGLSFDVSVRFSRVLRPVLLVLYIRKLRQMIVTIGRTLPHILDVLLLIFVLLIIYAIIALQLYAVDTSIYQDVEGSIENFNNLPNALISLFVLLTTENYPSIMYSAYKKSQAHAMFFVSFIILGKFVLLIIVAAICFKVYMEYYKKEVLQNRITERRGLLAAFRNLDTNDVGFLKFPQFLRLLKVLYKRMSVEQVNLLFDTLDRDNSRKIDVLEFFQLPDVLQLQFQQQQKERQWCPQPLPGILNRIPREGIRRFVDHKAFAGCIVVAILLNTVMMCFYRRGMSTEERNIYLEIDDFFLVLYIVEAIFKIVAEGIEGYWKYNSNRYDLFVVVCGSIFAILQYMRVIPSSTGLWPLGFKVLGLGKALRIFRFLNIAKRFTLLVESLARMRTLFAYIVAIILIEFYMYAIVGMELFSKEFSPLTLAEYPNPELNFNHIGSTLLTLFQLLVQNQGHTIMYAAVRATGTKWCCWYFITFYFLVSVTSLNVVVGLMLEGFHAQKLVVSQGSDVYVSVHGSESTSSSNVWRVSRSKRPRRWSRELFINHIGQITDTELTQLKQYSDIDLVKLHNQKQHRSNLHSRERGFSGNRLNQRVMDMVYRPNAASPEGENSLHSFGVKEASVGMGEEPVTVVVDQPKSLGVEQLREVFDRYDPSSSGAISVEDFERIIGDLGIELSRSEMLMSFMVLDTNSDGLVLWDDFVTLFSDLEQFRRAKTPSARAK